MKITVLISQSERDSIPRLKDFFDKRFISSSFFLVDPQWTLNGEKQLVGVLRESFDFLIVCKQSDLNARWIPYITGYSQKKGEDVVRRINTIFFLHNITNPLPLWLSDFSVVRNFSSLNHYFKSIEFDWHRLDDVLAANRFLEISGYDNFSTPTLVGDSEKDKMLLELFIERGGDPNFVSENGVPLLNSIIRRNEPELVAHLMHRGCDVNIIARDRGTNSLMEAASAGRSYLVRMLISKGAELNIASKEGQTALILAIGNQHEETARILLDAGAESDHSDNLGMTALKYAKLYGFTSLIERLEEKSE